MSAEKTMTLQEAWDNFWGAVNSASAQVTLTSQCKMRRFYLVQFGEIRASGVVFEDSSVALRWNATNTRTSTRKQSTSLYENVETMMSVHGEQQRGLVLKYIDAIRA